MALNFSAKISKKPARMKSAPGAGAQGEKGGQALGCRRGVTQEGIIFAVKWDYETILYMFFPFAMFLFHGNGAG